MNPGPTAQSTGREAISILLVALVLRIGFVIAFDTPGDVDRGAWEWGYEAASIARSITEGHGGGST